MQAGDGGRGGRVNSQRVATERLRTNRLKNPYWEAMCILPLLLTHRLCYNLIGAVLSRHDTDYGRLLATAWDFDIPYVPVFVLPYLFTWVYAGFIFFYTIASRTYDQQTFRYLYLSSLVMTGVECLIWYSFPASVLIRVATDELSRSGWLGALTAYVYEKATPWNAIPSAHISFSYIAWLFSKHFAPAGQRWLFLLLFILICLSVLFIKNHYLVDIAGGMALGHLIYMLVFLPASRRKILAGLSTSAMLGFYYLVYALAAIFYLVTLWFPWS